MKSKQLSKSSVTMNSNKSEADLIRREKDMELSSVGDRVYAAECILRRRVVRKKVQYLVKWKGYSPRHNTWEPEENILDERLILAFEQTQNEDYNSSSGHHNNQQQTTSNSSHLHHNHHHRHNHSHKDKKEDKEKEKKTTTISEEHKEKESSKQSSSNNRVTSNSMATATLSTPSPVTNSGNSASALHPTTSIPTTTITTSNTTTSNIVPTPTMIGTPTGITNNIGTGDLNNSNKLEKGQEKKSEDRERNKRKLSSSVNNHMSSSDTVVNHVTSEKTVRNCSPPPDFWKKQNKLVDQILITDVTANDMTITVRECKTVQGFFRERTKKSIAVATEPSDVPLPPIRLASGNHSTVISKKMNPINNTNNQ